MPERSETERKEALWKKIVDHIAADAKSDMSNGNRTELSDSKSGSAQRGGPDVDKADDRQPPDSFRRSSEEP